MDRRTALKTLAATAGGLLLPFRLPAAPVIKPGVYHSKGDLSQPIPPIRVIWHKVPDNPYPVLFFGVTDNPRMRYFEECPHWDGFQYWAEICGPARPEKWGPSKMSRYCHHEPPGDDFFGTWVFNTIPKLPENDTPLMTASVCCYRVPGRTWACGEDLTVEPDYADPMWRYRQWMVIDLVSKPIGFKSVPLPAASSGLEPAWRGFYKRRGGSFYSVPITTPWRGPRPLFLRRI